MCGSILRLYKIVPIQRTHHCKTGPMASARSFIAFAIPIKRDGVTIWPPQTHCLTDTKIAGKCCPRWLENGQMKKTGGVVFRQPAGLALPRIQAVL